MDMRVSGCAGCLLGLAVGDAMGYAVDNKTWEEIRLDYGPDGLLGYDSVNGRAVASSHTQIAAYVANGLLLAVTRGKHESASRFVGVALKEWARKQNLPGDPEKCYCWVSHMPVMRQRRCKDIRMLDALRMELGTPEKPANRHATPGPLTGAMMVGLAYDEKYMDPRQVGVLGAQVVALTNGSPYAFLSGAVLSNLIAGILHDPELPLKEHVLQAVDAMHIQYAFHPQVEEVTKYLTQAITLAESEKAPRQVMEEFSCRDSHECTAAAIYASLVCAEDFDAAMILAINHSGRSGAVGALVGGILGAKLGAEALPEFYLETLECGDVLQTLAADLATGSPMSGLFNDDWDHKYIQGLPLSK